jgi:hypothetical protein
MSYKSKECCKECGKKVYEYNIINLSSKNKIKPLCTRCFNKIISERAGLDFDHPSFEVITLKDADGTSHEFAFRTILVGGAQAVSIEAIETGHEYPEGYQFQIFGNPEEDPLELFSKLYKRMCKALKRKHLKYEGRETHIGDDMIVRGRIGWDDETNGEIPILIIDGKPITWEKLGRMLMSFEGFQFKLKLYDRSEEC